MIDAEGYRANVAIILINKQHKVFWARRIRQTSWQFPQGGVKTRETPLHAMYRELYEEVGLRPTDVEVISVTPGWLKYKLPINLIRASGPRCIGQKQKWFLLRFVGNDTSISFQQGEKPEFDGWRWVSYWYPLSQIITFKRHVYRRALETFHRYAIPKNHSYQKRRSHTISSHG